MTARSISLVLLVALGIVPPFGARPSAASDGALEIHRACVATGCFPGDWPGFPVEITVPGSYRLTSNLQVPDASTTGIVIPANDVVLDLGGFTVAGITECGPSVPDPCTPTGGGNGIAGAGRRTTIVGGDVRGMGGAGIVLVGGLHRVERVHATSNGGNGIELLTAGGVVRDCTSLRNGGTGIEVAAAAVVRGNVAAANNGAGIGGGVGGVFRDNSASGNGGTGLSLGAGSVATGNSLTDNAGAGLSGPAAAGFGGNTLSGNSDGTPAGQVAGNPTQLGSNLCAGSLCP